MTAAIPRLREPLLLLACLLLLVSLLMPAINRSLPISRYLLVFDISQSMNVEDVVVEGRASSRLEASKKTARSLIQALPCGSKVGLAVFAATRTVTLLTPLDTCEHYDGLLTSLDAIDGRMRFKNASSVGKGVHQSLRAANTIGNDTAIAMFTDGQEAPPLSDGHTGMPKSEGYDIRGFIVGVGGDQPARIPKVDYNGVSQGYWQAEEVTQLPERERSGQPGEELSSIREPHLRQLSQLSGLSYVRMEGIESLVNLLSSNAVSLRQVMPVNMSWIPASLALLLLCLRFLPRTLLRRD